MAKNRTIGAVVFGLVLVAVLIATLVLTALILNKVQQNENDGTTSVSTKTALTTLTTLPTGAALTTTVTNVPTTTSPTNVSLHPFVYTYEGQFTDGGSTWDVYLSSPASNQFNLQQQVYRQQIQDVLNEGYEDAYAYVAYFTNDAEHIRVYFTISVSNATNPYAPSAKALQIELENRAKAEGKQWTMMSVTNMGQQTLPPISTSKGWKDASDMFLNAIDTSVDPCDDFYAFSCNKWIQQHPLNKTQQVSYFSLLDDQIVSQMQDLLANFPTDGSVGPKSLQTATLYYKACVSSQSGQYEGAKRLLDILSSFGGWPIITPAWKVPSALFNDLSHVMGALMNTYGVPTLLTPAVEVDWRNVSRHRLNIGQATLTAPASIYRTPVVGSIMQVLQATIMNTAYVLANITGTPIDPEAFGTDVVNMVQFEYQLAMISVLPDQERNESLVYNPENSQSAHKKWPKIDWATYMSALTSNHAVQLENLETYIINEPAYQDGLNELLATNYSSPDGIRTVYNYLLWRFITNYIKFGGPDFLAIMAEFRRQTRPEKDALPPPESTCAAEVRQVLPWAIGRLYVDKYFDESERMKAGIMVSVILAAFRGQVSGLTWMDDLSKLLSMRKIYNLVKNVGYPDFIKNDTQLDDYHEWINTKIDQHPDTNYMDFVLDIAYFGWDKDLQLLSQIPDRTEFLMSPTTVNAWYQPERNSITLPAAILNPPFYRADFPMAVNYGGIGAVMGHELTHGFDDQGVQYDYNGTLNTWLGAASQMGFSDMASCAVQQYDSYCYDALNNTFCVNGQETQGENIADNGGIKAAYQAYKAYVASNGEEPRLPNMESFTMEQLFFLSYGNIWCELQSDEVLAMLITTNEHSPARSRVNGTLQNFEPFAAAFGCRPGDRMYPVNHCNIW